MGAIKIWGDWRLPFSTVALSLFSTICLCVLIAILISPTYLAVELAKYQTERSAYAWQKRTLAMFDNPRTVFETRRLSPAEAEAMRHLIGASDTFRVVLYDREGVAFWSSDGAPAGHALDAASFQKVLKSGGVLHETTLVPTDEIEGFGADARLGAAVVDAQRRVSDVAVPVFFRDGFAGVIEHFHDKTELVDTYCRWLRLMSVIGGIIVVLVLGAFTVGLTVFTKKKERLLRDVNAQQKLALDRDKQRNREIRLLSELNEWLQSCKSLDELYEMVEAFMSNLFPNGSGALYVYSNSRDALVGACKWNSGVLLPQIHADDCWGLRRGRAYSYGLNEVDFKCSHATDVTSDYYLCVPIVAHGETVGLLHLDPGQCSKEEFLDMRRLALMSAEHISLAIANARLRDQLRDQSVSDPLTGLFNRRYFTETCAVLFENARRAGDPVSLVSFDVDHFKRFNDNHGHDAGDIVLRSVAELAKRFCQGREFICRVGGEEFILVFPAMAAEDAAMRAEEFRAEIEKMSVSHGGSPLPQITVSLGVADFPNEGDGVDAVLKVADEALYRAKAAGRNQVVVAAHPAADVAAEPVAETAEAATAESA